MSYTTDELNQAIEKIVRSSVRFQYDSIGLRRTDVSFNDLQDAAAGVFVRFEGAPFYLARIAADRLAELVASEVEFLDEFISTARATSRTVGPVGSLANLAQARVALGALATASNNRDNSFESIEDNPAYKRFDRNTSSWLSKEGVKVRQGGDIVKSPTEAQGQLKGMAQELRSRHDEVFRRAELLKNCIKDYEGLSLPATLAGSIIKNAEDVLQEHLTELGSLKPEARIEKIRAVTLDVLAARACVKGFGSLTVPGLFAIIEGDGQPLGDSSHAVLPAALVSTIAEPYNFFEGQSNLALVADNAGSNRADVTLQMPSSYVPFLTSFARNPVALSASATFTVDVPASGVPASPITIPPGTYELYELAAVINVGLTVPAEAYVRLVGGITTIADALAGSDIIFRVPGSELLPLPTPTPQTWVEQGLMIGDYVLVIDRASGMYRSLWWVTAFQIGDYEMVCAHLDGATAALGSDISIEVGNSSLQMLSIGLVSGIWNQSLNEGWTLVFSESVGGDLFKIGFQPTTITPRQTRAVEVAAAVNISPMARDLFNVARVSVEAVFTLDIFTGKGRTNPASNYQVFIYSARGEATITNINSGPTPGTSWVTLSLSLSYDWSLVADGDVLVIRETEVIADMDKALTALEFIGPSTVHAVIATGSVPTIDGLPVVVEVVPSITVASNVTTLILAEGLALDGTYEVSKYDPTEPGLLTLNVAIPLNQQVTLGGLPFFLEEVQWGRQYMVFRSLNTTLSSYLQVRDTVEDVENPPAVIPVLDDASSVLFSTVPASAHAYAYWFTFEGKNVQVEEGDSLELYNTNPRTATSSHTIWVGENTYQSIRVDPPVPLPQAALPFGVGAAVPFGRVRKARKENFNVLEAALESWVSSSSSLELSFFRTLDAAVNPVVSTTHPTAATVGTLVSHLQGLQTFLGTLTTTLDGYASKVVEQVDALLKGYRGKGADRAADILEEGRFSDFFGLSMDGASYGGRLQETMKAAARELPIRKDNRQGDLTAGAEQIIAQYEDVDLEYTDDTSLGGTVELGELSDGLPGSLPTP